MLWPVVIAFGPRGGPRAEVALREREARALRDKLNEHLGEYSAPLSPTATAALAVKASLEKGG